MKAPAKFACDRLVLRRPRMDDALDIFNSYAHDPEATRYMTWRPHEEVIETRRILKLIEDLWDEGQAYSYVITLKGADSAIGMIAVHPEGSKAGIGYILSSSFWGKGYMTEAASMVVNWLLAQSAVFRVFATCDIDNSASARVMVKVGMQCEGLLRRYIVHPNIGDVPRDSYMYAVVK